MAHEGGTIVRHWGRLVAAYAEENKFNELLTTKDDMICAPFVVIRDMTNKLATLNWRSKFIGYCIVKNQTTSEVFQKCTTNR